MRYTDISSDFDDANGQTAVRRRSITSRPLAAWLATAIAVLLIPALLLPVLLARAASPGIELSPSTQLAGETVQVSGHAHPGQINGLLTIDGTPDGMPSFHVDGQGEFTVELQVPSSADGGAHEVAAIEGHPPTPGNGHADMNAPLASARLDVVSDEASPTATATGTVIATPSASETATPTATATATVAPTSAPTATATATATPAPTATATPEPTATPTPKPTATPTPKPTATPTPTPRPASAIKHVVMVWMENEEASGITATSMPYLYGLSQIYGRAEQFYGVTHPSQPNYLALWSGSTHGVDDNGSHDIDAPSLSSQLTAKGLQWRAYQQNYPDSPGCHTGSTYSGGVDGWGEPGTYARKHNPAISFTSVNQSASECAKIQPLANFDTSAAVTFVTPNLCNDMHDCSLRTGDAFLEAFLPQVFNSPDWPSTLLIVSFDEGSTDINGGGKIFTMFARQGMTPMVSQEVHDHYSVTRSVEDLFGLSCLANACKANPVDEFLP
jgi:acid phosphatase